MLEQVNKNYEIGPTFSIDDVAKGVEDLMIKSGCETHIISSNELNRAIQCRNDGGTNGWLKGISGTSKALTVNLTINGNILNAQVGTADWTDKIVGGALGLFVFIPLAFTTGYGLYKQEELKNQIINYIQSQAFNSTNNN